MIKTSSCYVSQCLDRAQSCKNEEDPRVSDLSAEGKYLVNITLTIELIQLGLEVKLQKSRKDKRTKVF